MILKKRIVFLSAPSFPFGQASSNRVLTLAKGIIMNEYACDVICTSSSFWPTVSEVKGGYRRKGEFEKINFFYTCPVIKSPSSVMLRKINTFFGFIYSIFYVLFKYNKKNTSCLIISHTPMHYLLIYGVISRILKIKLVFLRSEYPNFVINSSKLKKFYEQKVFNIILNQFIDGGLYMTTILGDYFNKLTSNTIPSEIIPLTIEVDKYKIDNRAIKEDINLIIYSGSLSDSKEGISNLLKAFSAAIKVNDSLKLILYGSLSSIDDTKYKAIIKENQLADKVQFKGFIHINEIPNALAKASLLILPRPINIQAEGGFPTKLGEYLSTGLPVIATKTGEICKYLTNEKDSFLIDSNDPEIIKKAILEVFEDYDHALRIGNNGRLVAKKNFDMKINSKKIIQFIESLKKV